MDGTAKVWMDTVTVTGHLLPVAPGGTNLCTAPIAQASEIQKLRGYVVYTTTTVR